MPKFILIDHSLKGVGGHHFDYAMHVLRAAESLHLTPILATHRKFRRTLELPSRWTVLPLFGQDTYKGQTLYVASRSRPTRPARPHRSNDANAGFWQRLLGRTADRRCRGYRRQFAQACRRLFHRVALEPGDHVFLPTLSELDLQALADFLVDDPRTRAARWRLQFHFDMFEGRPSEYAAQRGRLDVMRRTFADALQRIPQHDVRCFSTTTELTEHFNQMRTARFDTLPYPVNPALAPRPAVARGGRPLRVACAGALRMEKGCHRLSDLIDALWDDYLAPGRVALHVQCNKRRLRLPTPERQLAGGSPQRGIVQVPHPLPPAEYAELIRTADVGLLNYDGRRYFARFSGVFAELIAAGVPVIVPAGCWMARQLHRPNQEYLSRLWRTGPVLRRLELADDNPDVSAYGFPVPAGAADLLVRFRRVTQHEDACHVRVRLTQRDAHGKLLGQTDRVVEPADDEAAFALDHLAPAAVTAHVAFDAAYQPTPPRIVDVQAAVLASSQITGGHHPLGAVGVSFTEERQLPALLRDVVENHPHYRESATAFAEQWARQYHPQETVGRLVGRGVEAQRDEDQRAA